MAIRRPPARHLAAARSISLLWLGSFFGSGCAFLTQILLARHLEPAAFGAFAAAMGMVMLIAPLASFGVGGFWLRAFGEEGWQALRWISPSIRYAALTTSLVLIALYAWAWLGPHDTNTRSLLRLLSMAVLGQVAAELIGAKLQLEERYFTLAAWQFLPHVLRLMSVLLLVFGLTQVPTLNGTAAAYAAISVTMLALAARPLLAMSQGAFALVGHGTPQRKGPPDRIANGISRVAAGSWPFGLAGVFYLIYFQSDIILLKYIAGDEAAGIYNVAFIVMAAVYMLPSIIYQRFLLPKIHRWSNHDRQKLYEVYRTGNWIMFALGLLAMVAVALFAPSAIRTFLGANYADAGSLLYILVLTAPIRFLAASAGAVLTTQHHMIVKTRLMSAAAAANILINLLLIPEYGAQGAAVATLISETLLLWTMHHFAGRHVFAELTPTQRLRR